MLVNNLRLDLGVSFLVAVRSQVMDNDMPCALLRQHFRSTFDIEAPLLVRQLDDNTQCLSFTGKWDDLDDIQLFMCFMIVCPPKIYCETEEHSLCLTNSSLPVSASSCVELTAMANETGDTSHLCNELS